MFFTLLSSCWTALKKKISLLINKISNTVGDFHNKTRRNFCIAFFTQYHSINGEILCTIENQWKSCFLVQHWDSKAFEFVYFLYKINDARFFDKWFLSIFTKIVFGTRKPCTRVVATWFWQLLKLSNPAEAQCLVGLPRLTTFCAREGFSEFLTLQKPAAAAGNSLEHDRLFGNRFSMVLLYYRANATHRGALHDRHYRQHSGDFAATGAYYWSCERKGGK